MSSGKSKHGIWDSGRRVEWVDTEVETEKLDKMVWESLTSLLKISNVTKNIFERQIYIQ